MSDPINSEFISFLMSLKKSEHYQTLEARYAKEEEILTKSTMNDREERPFDRGRAVGINWCSSLIDRKIKEYLDQQPKDTDQDTTDT